MKEKYGLLSYGEDLCIFDSVNSRGVKLTIHLHVVPRLRMRGPVPPLPVRLHGVGLS
jgi:hypothetical protein